MPRESQDLHRVNLPTDRKERKSDVNQFTVRFTFVLALGVEAKVLLSVNAFTVMV